MFKTLLGSCGLVILTFMMQLQGSAEHQVFCSENSCYTFWKGSQPCDNITKFCRENGSDLVSIETEEEWNFIAGIIQSLDQSGSPTCWYIGLEKKAGNWTWVNGRPLTICKWGKNQPGNLGDVAVISLNSRNCDEWGLLSVVKIKRNISRAYICETSKVRDRDPSAGYCRVHTGIPCKLEYRENGWIQICEFINYTCNLNCSVNNCSSNCYPVKFCPKNCSKAYRPLVDNCADTIYDESKQGWSRCNATKCNLTSGQQTFGTEHTCRYEGDQCNLKCSGINCTQTCKERISVVTVTSTNSLLSATAKPPASISPASISPSSISPSSISPPSRSPSSRSPSSILPLSISPSSISPSSISPSSISPSSISPSWISPSWISPSSITPSSIWPAWISPASISPASISPVSISPSSISPSSISPSSMSPSPMLPSSMLPSSMSPSSSPSPSNAIQNLANHFVSHLGGLDSSRNTSLQKAVDVFENFLVRFENMTEPLKGLSTMMEVKTGRESIFKVAIAFEEFALDYSKQRLRGTMLSEEIVSQKMVLRIQKAYRQNASDLYLDLYHEWKTSIIISSSNFADNGSVVVECFYKNLHELLPKNQPNRNTGITRYVGTGIIMAAMDPTPEKLLENVIVKFKNVKIEKGLRKCMFWSGFNKSSDGFSDEGCHLVTSKSTSEETVCSCNHLTHFAVLFDYDDNTKLSKQDETALEIITYVGSSLSIIGILLTTGLYTTLTDVREPLSQIRLSLSVSLGAGQLTFLAGINANENPAACVTIAALMQYFLMASFCWMLVEGIYFYLFVVKVYNVNTKMRMYHVIAWGLPAIMVSISLGIASGREGIQSYTSDKYCWLSSTNKLIWIFIAFVAFIEILNILILVRVIREMNNLVQPTAEESHFQQMRLGIKACVVMSPLLGVSWLFGFLSPVNEAFAFIFTILNSTQGFLIFVLHGLQNTQIRERLKRKMNVVITPSNVVSSTRKSPQVNSNEVDDVRAVELQSRNNFDPELHCT